MPNQPNLETLINTNAASHLETGLEYARPQEMLGYVAM